MFKSIIISESDCKCYTCQQCAQDCSCHNNLFRDILSAFGVDDSDNGIHTIDLSADGLEFTGTYKEDDKPTSTTVRDSAKDGVTDQLEPHRQTVAQGSWVSIYNNPDLATGYMYNRVIKKVVNAQFRHNWGYWIAHVRLVGEGDSNFYVLTNQTLYNEDKQPCSTEVELKTLEQNNMESSVKKPHSEPTLLSGEFRIVQTESIGTPVYDDSERHIIGYNHVVKRIWVVTPADYHDGFYEQFENPLSHRACVTLYETKFFSELTEEQLKF